jgi:hypothetical protein
MARPLQGHQCLVVNLRDKKRFAGSVVHIYGFLMLPNEFAVAVSSFDFRVNRLMRRPSGPSGAGELTTPRNRGCIAGAVPVTRKSHAGAKSGN